jgi:serine/threonine protein kinase
MVLAGRYRLLSQLGQGGMGIVWRAVDELLRQEVAVKEVRPPADLDQITWTEVAERTLREARAAARLRSHPSIVTVHDVVMDGGRPWIIMELIQGRSLDRIIREEGPLSPRHTAQLGLHVLDALTAAHSAGVLHRDVKPANVLITTDGRVLLTDFGIATVSGEAALTQTGLLTGSPGYIAPERLRGEADGPQADLWSLGATLYTSVEGRPAFTGPNAAAVMAAVLLRDPTPTRLAGPLAPLLTGLLEKDPARRCDPSQATTWMNAAAQGIHPEIDTPKAPKSGTALPGRRRPVILGGLLAAMLSLAAGIAIWRVVRIPATTSRPPSTGTTSTSPTTSGSPAAERLFGADPYACRLLTAAQARTLLGGTAERRFYHRGGCEWRRSLVKSLSISIYRSPTIAIARRNFDGVMAQMKDERKRYPGTKLRRDQVVGDETYAFTHTQLQTDTQAYQTQVAFRLSNVQVIIIHLGPRPGYDSADHAAKLIAAALETNR